MNEYVHQRRAEAMIAPVVNDLLTLPQSFLVPLKMYTYIYDGINAKLRNSEPLTFLEQSIYYMILSVFDLIPPVQPVDPTDTELILWRGLSKPPDFTNYSKGCVSTSISVESAVSFASGSDHGHLLKIHVPLGTSVLPLMGPGLTMFIHEAEVLLPSHGVYRITGQATITEGTQNMTIYDVQYTQGLSYSEKPKLSALDFDTLVKTFKLIDSLNEYELRCFYNNDLVSYLLNMHQFFDISVSDAEFIIDLGDLTSLRRYIRKSYDFGRIPPHLANTDNDTLEYMVKETAAQISAEESQYGFNPWGVGQY